ncbi:MAG: hypothetical protein ACI9W6_001029 [Motiliproteus sp.]|jgi:uncharacterized protein (TIGR02099 family)
MGLSRIHHLRHWVVSCCIALILVLLVALSASRWLVLNLTDYKADLEQLISDAPRFQVSVGELHGSWSVFSPGLEATSVRVTLEGGRHIDVGRMELQLDILRSLWRGEVVFRQVLLDQLSLSLYRSLEQGWNLVGSYEEPYAGPDPATSTRLMPLLQALLAQQQLEIRNALVQVQFEAHAPLPPQLINLTFQNRDDDYALVGRLVLGMKQAIELRVLLHGLPGEVGFSSEFYFKSPVLDQQFWGQFVGELPQLPQLPQLPRLPEQFQLGAELWGNWRPDGKHQLQGAIQLPQLDWQQGAKALTVADAGLRFNLALDGLQQAELAITDLQGLVDGVALPLDRLSLRKQDAVWLISSDRVALEPLWQIVNDGTLVAASLKQRLAGLDPVGELRNLRLELQQAFETGSPVFDFSADLNRVGVSPWRGAPGIQGVSGLLQLNAEGGQVDFAADQVTMNLPKFYSQGWQFDSARGVINWDLRADGIQVVGQHLQVRDSRLRADGRFSLDLPAKSHPEQPGRLVLMVGMGDADATLVPLFVPDKLVSKPLFDWLQQSIQGGEIRTGGVMIDTPLRTPVGVSPEASVQLFFHADQASVRYQSGWPTLTQANPFVLIKGGEVLVEIPDGRLLGTDLSRGRVYLPAAGSLLQIEAELDGPAADIRTTLIEGPVRAVLGEALQPWQLDGISHSRIALGIDLQDPQHSQIRVESSLADGLLSNAGLDLDFSQLAGTLRYHEREGLSSERLSGSLLGQPLQAAIITEPYQEGSRTLISVDGWIGADPLKQWLRQPLLQPLLQNVQGEAQYQARLELCTATSACSMLRIDSELRGVVAELPAPFGKTAEQSLHLGINIGLGGSPDLRLRYAQLLDFAMPLADSFSGAELVLGRGQPAAVSRGDGLWIRGQLDRLNVAPWQAFITQAFIGSDPSATELQTDPAAILRRVELDIGRLDYGALEVKQLQAELLPGIDSWALKLDSPMIRGRVLLPIKQGVVRVELEHLRLPHPESEEPEQKAPTARFDPNQDPLVDFDPRLLPAAQVSIAALHHGNRDLGRWDFELQPSRNGVLIKGIDVKIGRLGVVADLDWGYQNSLHSSYVDLTLSAADLGQVLQEWGAAPNVVTESALLNGQFLWEGSPLAFNLDTLDGEATIQLKGGKILNSGAGTQVMKIFSLFNTSTLWRRLSLDFSDLTQDGISFDTLAGHYRISDAVASSLVPLTLVGPTLGLEFEGSVDLYNETLNQRMLVSLPISENLPLAAVFLATPQIAGAVFIVEKLIGKQLSKFTSVRYSIEGLWTDPQMELIKPVP